MNRHKLKGTLRAKQQVPIRCIMCGDMRRVTKASAVRQLYGQRLCGWAVSGQEWSGCEVCERRLCDCATSSGQTNCEVVRNQG
ncbi:hypothetical protein YC2023_033761 [Brassica napus]